MHELSLMCTVAPQDSTPFDRKRKKKGKTTIASFGVALSCCKPNLLRSLMTGSSFQAKWCWCCLFFYLKCWECVQDKACYTNHWTLLPLLSHKMVIGGFASLNLWMSELTQQRESTPKGEKKKKSKIVLPFSKLLPCWLSFHLCQN